MKCCNNQLTFSKKVTQRSISLAKQSKFTKLDHTNFEPTTNIMNTAVMYSIPAMFDISLKKRFASAGEETRSFEIPSTSWMQREWFLM